jgi:hypothetical protein
MKKHFVNGSKVELIYDERTKTNPKSHLYDEVVIAETPERPETKDSEIAQLMYENVMLYWEVRDK